MRHERAQEIAAGMDRYVHHDRIFLNNPAVMQGMGLAPLVIAATTGRNAVMLLTAVALLLTPTRVLCSLLLHRVRHPLLRAIGFCGVAAVVYIPVYLILVALFGTDLLQLGIYLPLLAVEPLIVYRHGRVPEPASKALSKGLRITLGYALVLLLTGCLREVLALGTLFGAQVTAVSVMPVLSLPGGGFLLLGVLFAIWRACCSLYKKRIVTEAEREE